MKYPVDALRPGMVLARNLKQGDRVLLREGTELSETMIETIKKRGVKLIDVLAEDRLPRTELDEGALLDNPDYHREHQEIIDLFATAERDDEQVDILKYCLMRQLGEKYRNES